MSCNGFLLNDLFLYFSFICCGKREGWGANSVKFIFLFFKKEFYL
jgi:hypothetical protein